MDSIARLTDIPFPTDFSAKIPALSLVDATLRQIVFNWKAAKATSDFTHLAPMILAFMALLLGSWDLGSGELSGAGTTTGEGFLVLKAVFCGCREEP